MDKKVIGLKIKELRSKKSLELGYKYTGEMLANDLNISRSYLGDIESGRTLPNQDLIAKLTMIFKVSENYFSDNAIEKKHKEEFDEDAIAIAIEFQKLTNEKKDLFKKLIKTMSDSSDEELNK